MNADKFEIIPDAVITDSSGRLAIDARLVRLDSSTPDEKKTTVVGREKDLLRSVKKARSRNGVRSLKILVEPAEENHWRLATDVNPTGERHAMGEAFDLMVGKKTERLQVESVKLDSRVARVKRKGITAAQVLLFVPALALDIVTSPVQAFIYGKKI
jgi:hypothetical protein